MKKLVIIVVIMIHTMTQAMVQNYVCSSQDVIVLKNLILEAASQAVDNNDFNKAYELLDKGLKYDRFKKIENFEELVKAVIERNEEDELKLYAEFIVCLESKVSCTL